MNAFMVSTRGSVSRMDWNLLKTFISVAEHGSLSQAAKALRSSQPTVGRHVQELQQQLGVELFVRHARGLDLSAQGVALYDMAQEVRRGVARFEMGAQTMSDEISGTVRISASEVVAIYVLPALLVPLRRAYPGIQLEIVAQDTVANLVFRDVDIAVRMLKPQALSLVARKVATSTIGLYATQEYLDAHTEPGHLTDIHTHTVIGLDALTYDVEAIERAGVTLARQDFAVRCDAQPFHIESVCAGLGIGAIQDALAVRRPGLVRLDLGIEFETLPLWLVTHESLRHSARIRVVLDALGAGLEAFYSET